jgi:hypothetical protein
VGLLTGVDWLYSSSVLYLRPKFEVVVLTKGGGTFLINDDLVVDMELL